MRSVELEQASLKETGTNVNGNKQVMRFSTLFSAILLFLMLVPAFEGFGLIRIFWMFTYSLIGLYLYFYSTTKLNKKELIVMYPIISFLFIISVSHLKGAMTGVDLSFSDFSDYFKFFLPVSIFFITVYLLKFNKAEMQIYSAIFISMIFYSLLFLIYFFDGGSFIYSIGLGRGASEFYRYGGIDQNPNAYASIAYLLLLISIPFAMVSKHKLLYFVVMSALLMSAIAAQSRTSLIAFSFILILLLPLLPIKKTSKFLMVLLISSIVVVTFINIDLYWLISDNRFDVANDNSFGTRIENSLTNYYRYSASIGFFGIGPGREALDRLDTITYIMYFLRYGYLGIANYIMLHLWISVYFFYFLYINRTKFYFKKDKKSYIILLVNILIPIFTLILNISNEKWIDIKYLTLWFVFIAIGVSSISMYKTKIRNYANAS